MCVTGCGGLFEKGKRLDEVSCICKRGYWDVFQVLFVDGDQIRAGQAPKREEYEKIIREKLSLKEYESKIRVQGFIRHFLTCPIKREQDNHVTRDGKNDGSTVRLALTEWMEFELGDYTSKGTSRELDAATLADIWKRVRGFPVTAQELGLLQSGQTPIAAPQRALTHDRATVKATIPKPTNVSHHGTTSSRTTAAASGTGGASASRDYFLPEEGLHQDVLTHYCGQGSFGLGATIGPYTYPDGRRGFLIRGTIQPTTETIRQLRIDSKKWKDSMRKRPDSAQRPLMEQKQIPSRHQDCDVYEPSPGRQSSDVLTQEMKSMSISTHEARHSSVSGSQTSTARPPLPGQQPQQRDSHHSRVKNATGVDEPSAIYIDPAARSEEPSRHQRPAKEDESGATYIGTPARYEQPTRQQHGMPGKWQCCHCGGGPHSSADTKVCNSLNQHNQQCRHPMCQHCKKDSQLPPPVTTPPAYIQSAQLEHRGSQEDPEARRPVDARRHSSTSDLHNDSYKETQKRRPGR